MNVYILHYFLLFDCVVFVHRIHELQEEIIKINLDLENAQGSIEHLNTQVRYILPRGI